MQSKDLLEKHKDNAGEALLYWVNSTNLTAGPSLTVALLIQSAKMVMQKATTAETVDSAVDIAVGLFEEVRKTVKNEEADDGTSVGDMSNESVDWSALDKKIKH